MVYISGLILTTTRILLVCIQAKAAIVRPDRMFTQLDIPTGNQSLENQIEN